MKNYCHCLCPSECCHCFNVNHFISLILLLVGAIVMQLLVAKATNTSANSSFTTPLLSPSSSFNNRLPPFHDPFFNQSVVDQDQEQIVSRGKGIATSNDFLSDTDSDSFSDSNTELLSSPSASRLDSKYFIIGISGAKNVGKTFLIETFLELSGKDGNIICVEQMCQDSKSGDQYLVTVPVPTIKVLGLKMAFVEVHWPLEEFSQNTLHRNDYFATKYLIIKDTQTMDALLVITDDRVDSWSYAQKVEDYLYDIPIYHIRTKQDAPLKSITNTSRKNFEMKKGKGGGGERAEKSQSSNCECHSLLKDSNLIKYRKKMEKSLIRVSSITGENILETLEAVMLDLVGLGGSFSLSSGHHSRKLPKSPSTSKSKNVLRQSSRKRAAHTTKRQLTVASRRRRRESVTSFVSYDHHITDPLLLHMEEELDGTFIRDDPSDYDVNNGQKDYGLERNTRKLDDERPTKTCFDFCIIL